MNKLFLLAIFFFFIFNLNAQKKISLNCGYAIPEGVNIGLNYYINDNNLIGSSIGTYFLNKNFSISIHTKNHFGGKSKYCNTKKKYNLFGVGSFSYKENNGNINSIIGIFDRVGKEIQFSKKASMGIEIGLIYFNQNDYDVVQHYIVPSFSLSFSYRF
jgi:hypothetical protein